MTPEQREVDRASVAPDVNARALAVTAQLGRLGLPERREVAKTYFPTAMKVLGVPVPELRKVVRLLLSELRKAPAADVLALADALVAQGCMESRQVAYELVAGHRPAADALTPRRVEALGKGMDNWASVDCFSVLVSGPAWRKGLLSDALITRWTQSPDRWWSRAGVVSTVALNRRSKKGVGGDAERTLAICSLVVAARDDMVVKGLSWALRELSKCDPDAVRQFLRRHDELVSPRVRREVKNKLETGLKNRRAEK